MSKPEPRSPLAGHWKSGAHGAKGPAPITFAMAHVAIVNVQARKGRGPELSDRFAAHLGQPLPPTGRTSSSGEIRGYWIAPDTWLVTSKYDVEGALFQRIAVAAGDAGSISDQTHGKTALGISGSTARSALDKICRIDLHPRAFPAGTSAVAMVAHLPVMIARTDSGAPGAVSTFDLIGPSTFAVTLLEALEMAAEEFGYIKSA